jgi:hypothetical protein
METITFQCSACQFTMKVGADKAGRKGKCAKCGAPITVPGKVEPAKVAQSAAEPPKAEPAKPQIASDDDDGQLTFAIRDESKADLPVSQVTDSKATRTGVGKGPGRRTIKRLAKITDPDEWRRVGLGCMVIGGALCLWLCSYLLCRLPLLLGMAFGEEYAAAADERLLASQIDSGNAPSLDLVSYGIAIVTGNSWATAMTWLIRVSQLLYLLQYAVLIAGYAICLVVPKRYGSRLQLIVLLAVAIFNALVALGLKILPTLGVYRYTILPFVVPEVVLVQMNAERVDSLYTMWLRLPALETTLALFLTVIHYLEPALIATFIRTVGLGTKSDDLEGRGLTLMKLSYGQLYAQIAWMMACLCGTSVVLLWVLRFLYFICVFFFAYQMLLTIVTLFTVPRVVVEQLGDQPGSAGAMEDEGDEDEEDEDD